MMAARTMLLVLTATAVCIVSAFHPGPSFYTQVVKHDDIEQKTNQLENRTDSVERTMSTIITAMAEIKSNITSLQVQCTKEELVQKDVKRPRTEEQINSKACPPPFGDVIFDFQEMTCLSPNSAVKVKHNFVSLCHADIHFMIQVQLFRHWHVLVGQSCTEHIFTSLKKELEYKIANLLKLVSKNDRKIQVLESQCKVSSKTTIHNAPSSHAEKTKSIPLSGGLQSNTNVQKLPGQVQVSSKITIEKAPSSNAGSICSSHEGYVQVSNKLCLKFSVRDPKSWDDSRKSCKRDGADLLTFYERKEQNDVIKFREAKDVGELFWIGVKRSRKRFIPISDSIFVGIWSPNSPSSLTSFNCVSLNKRGIRNKYCGLKYGYICQIRLPTTGYGASE